MARVRLCVCGSWFVGREGQAAHPRAPGQCLHFECRGAPARVRVWRCEGRPPPAPPLCVCGEIYLTLPYLNSVLLVLTVTTEQQWGSPTTVANVRPAEQQ